MSYLTSKIKLAQLEKRICSLSDQLKQAQLQKDDMLLWNDMLLGICRASTQAVRLLKSTAASGPDSSTSSQGSSILSALEGLESRIWQLLEETPGELSGERSELLLYKGNDDPFRSWRPHPKLGCSDQLISIYLDDQKLTGPSHASLLNGQVFSIVECAMLCLQSDPALLQAAHRMQDSAPLVMQSMQSDLARLLPQAEGHRELPLGPSVLHNLALRIMSSINLIASINLLSPKKSFRSTLSHAAEGPEAAPLLPPDHLYDSITEVMAPTQEQLQHILRGLQVFQELQAPLAKQKARVSTSISQLLLQTAPPAVRQGVLQGTAGPPQALQQIQPAAGPGRPPKQTSAALSGPEVSSQLAILDSNAHTTLASLSDELQRIQFKLQWLDALASWFITGQISWLQLARFAVGMYPYYASPLQWARRLVAHAASSLPFRMVMLKPGGGMTAAAAEATAAAVVAAAVQRLQQGQLGAAPEGAGARWPDQRGQGEEAEAIEGNACGGCK